jgi:hypothetical protein
VFGTLASQGHNLIGDGTGGSGFADTDLVGTATMPIDPLLGPLQDNGGPTFTRALLPDSPALNAGDPNQLGVADQRGVVRSGGVNIGAYQASASTFVITVPGSVASGTPFDVTVQAVDVFGQVAFGYRGTVTFSVTDPDPAVVLPADYTFTAADGGVHTFTDTGLGETTLITTGDQTVTATDLGSGITGTAPVTVTPAGQAPRGGGTGRHSLLMTGPSASTLVGGDGGMSIRGPTAYDTEYRMRSLSAGSNDSAGSTGATLPAPLPHEADYLFSRLASRVGKYSAVPVANDTTEGLIGDVIDPFALNNGVRWI